MVVVAVLFLAGPLLLLRGRRGHRDDYIGVSGAVRGSGGRGYQLHGDSRRRIWRPHPDPHRGPGGQVPRSGCGRNRVSAGTMVGRYDGDRGAQGFAEGHPAHVDHPGRRGGDADPRRSQSRRGNLVNRPAEARVWAAPCAAAGRPEPPKPASTQHVSDHNQNLTGWGTGAAAQGAGAALERVVPPLEARSGRTW